MAKANTHSGIAFANDSCFDAIPIACGETQSGNTIGAGFDDVPSCDGLQTNSSSGLWYSFVGDGRTATFSTCSSNTDFDTQISIYIGLCDELVCVAGADNEAGCNGASSLTISTEIGIIYKILVNGANGEAGDFDLSVYQDDPWLCAPVLECNTSVIGTTVGAPIPGADVNACIGNFDSGGRWYTVVGTGGCIKLTTCNFYLPNLTDFDTQLSLFNESGGQLNCIGYNNNGGMSCGNPGTSQLDLFLEDGDVYYLLVHGINGESGNYILNYGCYPLEPITVTCPADIVLSCEEPIPPFAATASEFEAIGGTIEGGACGEALFSTLIDDTLEGDLCDGEVVERVYTIFSNSGVLPKSCTQRIRRNPIEPPTISCGEPEVVVSCVGDITPSEEDVVITYTCQAPPELTISGPTLVAGSEGCTGSEYIVTYSVAGACNTGSYCLKRFIIGDSDLQINCRPDRIVECFDDIVPEYSEDVINTCNLSSTSFYSDPFLISGDGACSGSVYGITYTIVDVCGNEASCTQQFTIENDGLRMDCAPNRIVECSDDIVPEINNIQVNNLCGLSFGVTADEPVLLSGYGNCSGSQYGITYHAFNDCGNHISCTQIFTIQNEGTQVVVAPDVIVECADEVYQGPNDIQVTRPCGELVAIQVEGPIIADPTSPNCSGNTHTYRYSFTDDCGQPRQYERTFTIQNEGTQVVVAPNETVECADDIAQSPGDIQVTHPCGELVSIGVEGPFIADPTSPNCSGNTYTYRYSFTDECGQPQQYERVWTIQNEGTQVVVAPNVIVECADDIAQSPSDIQVTRPCGELVSIGVEGPFIADPSSPNCSGNTYTYRYSFTDDCGQAQQYERVWTIQNEGTQVTVAPDMIVECADEISQSPNDIIVSKPCGLFTSIQVEGPAISNPNQPNCSGTTHTYTYTFLDECGNWHEYDRVWTIQNAGMQVVYPANRIVECENEIGAEMDLVVVTTACDLGYSIDASQPELMEGLPGCPGAQYQIIYTITNDCGETVSDTQYFTIQNDPMQLQKAHPYLSGIEHNSTVQIACQGQDDAWSLPQLDASAFIAPTACNGLAEINYQFEDLGAADCANDGYLHRYHYSWLASDPCGNIDQFAFTLEVIDNTPPAISGIPNDITISCMASFPEVPQVIATDECHCSNITMEEEELPGDCSGNRTIVRTWTAWDCCGNTTQQSQRIFIKDQTGPAIQLQPTLGLSIANGERVELGCSIEGYPDWLDQLSEQSILVEESCAANTSISFSMQHEDSYSCATTGYLERHTPIWTVTDDCGNTSTFSFTILIKDDEAPLFFGSEVLYLCPGEEIGHAYAFDYCSTEQLTYTDTPHESCDGLIRRTYRASDDCGNYITQEQLVIDLSQQPQLITLDPQINLDVAIYECQAGVESYTGFTANDAFPLIECLTGLDIRFSETLVQNSCADGGAKLYLLWTATTPCAYTDSLEYWVDVIDNLPPYFEDFQEEITLPCGSAMPAVKALDDCGEVELAITEVESFVGCSNERVVTRSVTATDWCGQATSATQVVYFKDNEGPVFDLPAYTCMNETPGLVMAYDECSGTAIAATLLSEEVVNECEAFPVMERTWAAQDDCGNMSTFVQTVYTPDFNLEMDLLDEGLKQLVQNGTFSIPLSNPQQLEILEALEDVSVFATDPCGNVLIGDFSKHILPHEDCENGIGETRTYTWHFAEVCGEVYEYQLSFDILYDIPPYIDIDENLELYCIDELPELELYQELEGVTYSVQTTDLRNEAGDGQVIRMVTATDVCGNSTSVAQTIEVINTVPMEGAIIGDFTPTCNSENNLYSASIVGGIAPYTYEWAAEGGNCYITEVNGNTAELAIGFGQAKIQLTITDANGCETYCEAVVKCAGTGFWNNAVAQNPDAAASQKAAAPLALHAFPNPFNEIVTVEIQHGTASEYSVTVVNNLGQAILETNQSDKRFEIDLSSWPSGIYHLIVKGETTETTRLIKLDTK